MKKSKFIEEQIAFALRLAEIFAWAAFTNDSAS
jgi:hypothetical protein